jgi:hypothetical protein
MHYNVQQIPKDTLHKGSAQLRAIASRYVHHKNV